MIRGIGVDLVDIARVKRLIVAKGDRALARLFTPGEVAYAQARVQPYVHFAARIAAKEAAFKALAGSDAARAIAWREMEVVSDADGRPRLVLHGRAAARAAALGARALWLSMSHTDTTAEAVVMLDGD